MHPDYFPPYVPPEMRTSDVLAICEGMRATGDYSGTFALADALQEAGCSNAELLASLRDPDAPLYMAEALVACVYSEETRAAVVSLDALAHRSELSYREVVEGARRFIREIGAEAADTNAEYWRNFAAVSATLAPYIITPTGGQT